MLFALSHTSLVLAQNMKQENAEVFEKVKALIGKQDAAGLYALTDEDFKSHIGWVNFENFSKYGVFAQGTITASTLLNVTSGISTYQLTFPKGDFILKYIDGSNADILEKLLSPADVVRIRPGVCHQLQCVSKTGGKILEISTQHFEEDSYRVMKGDSQK